jgi:hypothetical protein
VLAFIGLSPIAFPPLIANNRGVLNQSIDRSDSIEASNH